ncbi:MAG TPA: hypothetical protein VIP46_05775 [Pyrinomonadaceae bacterium]
MCGDCNNSGGHRHVCRKCNNAFTCYGCNCSEFHFSVCPDCKQPKVEHDAPPPEREPEAEGDGWN